MGRAVRVQSIGKATTRPRLSAAVAPQSQRNLPVALAARGHCCPLRKPHGLGARKSFIVRRRREARYIICDERGRVYPPARRRMRGRQHGRPRLRRLLALAVKTRRRRTPLVRRGLMLPEGRAHTARCQLPRAACCASSQASFACLLQLCRPAGAGSRTNAHSRHSRVTRASEWTKMCQRDRTARKIAWLALPEIPVGCGVGLVV